MATIAVKQLFQSQSFVKLVLPILKVEHQSPLSHLNLRLMKDWAVATVTIEESATITAEVGKLQAERSSNR